MLVDKKNRQMVTINFDVYKLLQKKVLQVPDAVSHKQIDHTSANRLNLVLLISVLLL